MPQIVDDRLFGLEHFCWNSLPSQGLSLVKQEMVQAKMSGLEKDTLTPMTGLSI
jgi:hypothetical protein